MAGFLSRWPLAVVGYRVQSLTAFLPDRNPVAHPPDISPAFAVAEYPARMLLAIAPQQAMASETHWMLASLVISFRSSRLTSP